jgi:hypothetical protein
MCGRGAMRDALGTWNGFFAVLITPETNGLPKRVMGAEFLRFAPQPRTGVPASDTRAIAFHHP